jgi:hypothetical protein
MFCSEVPLFETRDELLAGVSVFRRELACALEEFLE